MSAIKLLPCPFCGSEPLEDRIEPHKHHIVAMPDYPGAWTIECVKCDYHMIDHDSKDAVIARWNTRIDALLKTGGWIRVEIELPDPHLDVLVFVPKQNEDQFDLIYMAHRSDEGDPMQFYADGEDFEPIEPTHWQPLPPLPEAK